MTSVAPARPASTPEMHSAFTVVHCTEMPAVSDAHRLKPTARFSKPSVVYFRMSQITTAAISATKIPMCARPRLRIGSASRAPSENSVAILGNCAEGSRAGV